MIIQLVKTDAGYEIINDEQKTGNAIVRKSGESDADYKERAIREFDAHVDGYKNFKEKLFKKEVVKSATV